MQKEKLKSLLYKLNLIVILAACGCTTIDTIRERKPPDEAEVLQTQMSIVVNYLNKAEPDRAHAELRALIAAHPENADLLNLMGLTQLSLKNFKSAERTFRNAIKIDNKPAYNLNLSSALIELGRTKDAIVLLRSLKEKSGTTYTYTERINHNIGLAWERRNNLKLAERYYLRALSDNPTSYATLLQLGNLYKKQKQDAKARTVFGQAAKTCATCLEPVKQMAITYLATKQPKEAVAVLNVYARNKEVFQEDRQQALKLAQAFDSAETTAKH